MSYPSIFYHYTSLDCLAGILADQRILASPPHPATPGMVGGSYIKDGAVFFTRMDPNNSKRAIAFNNYRQIFMCSNKNNRKTFKQKLTTLQDAVESKNCILAAVGLAS